jgi:hypothetical protein
MVKGVLKALLMMEEEHDRAVADVSVTLESSETNLYAVHQRLQDLESDAEGGWVEQDRHVFHLVRVPINFLQAVQLQVL